MVRRSLCDLSSSATIILFTPVITPAVAGKATNQFPAHVDPFEALGRALSRHHHRIRHVPFVPNVGFTETHDGFIREADAVVVVLCESRSPAHEGIGEQVDFALAAQDCIDHDDHLILVQCGDPSLPFWPDLSSFDNIVQCPTYDVGAAQDIARQLFRPTE